MTETNAAEETAQNTYHQESEENEIEETTKNQDGQYKTMENVEVELSAVDEYLKKIEDE